MRLGILGGTFDPPHVGHLILADQCTAALGLGRVILVPSFQPPHKLERDLSPFDARLAMIRLAIGGDPALAVLSLEAERGGVSYTVDTLRELHRRHGDDELWLLMGEDSLVDLPAWHNPEEILALVRLAVYRRRGARGALPAEWRDRVRIVEGPLVDVSSTLLRERLRCGASVRHLIPAAVRDYIARAALYGGADRGLARDSRA